jgi:hypothetical protein
MTSVQASLMLTQHSDCSEKSMRSKRQAAPKEPWTRWRALKLRTVSQVMDSVGGEPTAIQAEVETEREG